MPSTLKDIPGIVGNDQEISGIMPYMKDLPLEKN